MMRRVIVLIVGVLAVLCSSEKVRAQEKLTFSAGGDIVSSYVWRGVRQDGLSFQPSATLGYKGFYLNAWGSANVNSLIEMCWILGYDSEHFMATVADIWVKGRSSELTPKYFDYKMHHLEAKVAYRISYQLPLTFSWHTRLLGPDFDAQGRKIWSSYVEVYYPFSLSGFDLYGVVGAAPWKAVWFGDESPGFHVTNIGFGASRKLPITKDYGIRVNANFSYNPALNQVNFVLGLGI